MAFQNIDASASNVFAAAVGQFFLTLLPSKFSVNDRQFSTQSESLLRVRVRVLIFSNRILQHFNDPSLIYEKGKIDGILKFLMNSPIEKPGLHISPQLRTAFQNSDEEFSFPSQSTFFRRRSRLSGHHRNGHPNGQRSRASELSSMEKVLQTRRSPFILFSPNTSILFLLIFENSRIAVQTVREYFRLRTTLRISRRH